MKKIFKLAAIAVSMALVAGLVACSSGDDDVVDTSTGKYLVAKQIAQYVDSIEYNQNVSDDEIKSLKDAHEAVMAIIDDCEDCLEHYFGVLKSYTNAWSDNPVSSDGIESAIKRFKELKKYGKHEKYHRAYAYESDVWNAFAKVYGYYTWDEDQSKVVFKTSELKSKVFAIGTPDGDTILKGVLNDRQAASMKAYTDAFEALKKTLTEADSGKCTTIKAADKTIEDFGKLKTVKKENITDVIDAVDAACSDIQTNVLDKIYAERSEIEDK